MSDIDELYEQIASGEATPPDNMHPLRLLMQKAWEAARSPDRAVRRKGLTVAERMGPPLGLDVAVTYLEDPDPELRQAAFELGVNAGDEGLELIREACECNDPALATRGIEILIERDDRQSTSMMRRLLDSPHAPVRAAAVRLLGSVAGPAVLREIRALQEDDDPEVRAAAREAEGHITGEPPPEPEEDQWTEGLERPASPEAPPPPADADLPNLKALRAATVTSQGAVDEVATAPPPEPAAQLPVPIPEADPGARWEPAEPSPMPGELPSQALALLKLLGKVAVADRPRVLDALRKTDSAALGEAVSGYRRGGDAARGRGAALAAIAMGNARWVSSIRGFLDDPDPGVRCTALHALAGLAGPSLLPRMARLLQAPEPEVRACATWSLAEMGRRLGDPSLARHFLGGIASDQDPDVQAAYKAAQALLGAT